MKHTAMYIDGKKAALAGDGEDTNPYTLKHSTGHYGEDQNTSDAPDRMCNDCGERWTDTGSDECPFCGSDDTEIVAELFD